VEKARPDRPPVIAGCFTHAECGTIVLWQALGRRRHYASHGAYVNAATCGLDLAGAHLANGDMDAAAAVAGRLFPIFGKLRHNREAQASLVIFQRAAEARRLDGELIRDVRRRLEASA